MLENAKDLGATVPSPVYADRQALLAQIAGATGLVSTLLDAMSAAQDMDPIAAAGGWTLHRAGP
ncbi:MAG: hypothetical protein WBP81_23975 [Solirubrobacteraceae bacterium]